MKFIKLLAQILFHSAPDSSPKKKLNELDFAKLFIHCCYVALSAVIAYLFTVLGQIDFGLYTLFVVPIVSTILQAGQKFIKDNRPDDDLNL